MTDERSELHPRARAFDRIARAYERGRPGYAAAAVRFVARELGLRRGRTVVELGCGTGKLTRSLRRSGVARVGVEPLAGMRAVFRSVLPSTVVLDGTAERIPLPNGFADAVVAAQAFQWFRTGPALREIDRVLGPDGRLALLWNVRLSSTPASRAINRLHDRCVRALPRTSARRQGRGWPGARAAPAYGFRLRRMRSFPHVQRASSAAIVQATLSESAVGLLPPRARQQVAATVRAILARHAPGRLVRIPYRTEVYVIERARRRRSAPTRARRRTGATRRTPRTSPGSGRLGRRTERRRTTGRRARAGAPRRPIGR